MKGSDDTHSQAFRRKYDTTLHTRLLALFIPLQFCCHLWMKEIEQAETVLGGSSQTVDCLNSDYVTAFHPDGRIILPCSTFTLKEMAVISCNCDFVYRPIALQLQQKSNLAKSESSRTLSIGYPNPVSGRKSISVHP